MREGYLAVGWGFEKLSGLRESRGEDATHFLLSCQETQRWREKILGKKGLQVNDAVASKKLVWLSVQSCKSAASRHILKAVRSKSGHRTKQSAGQGKVL